MLYLTRLFCAGYGGSECVRRVRGQVGSALAEVARAHHFSTALFAGCGTRSGINSFCTFFVYACVRLRACLRTFLYWHERQYVIEWGPTGFTQGTGIPYDSITGANWSIDTLTSNTTYDLYIQSICPSQGMNSPWYGPVTVTTPCSPVSTPWSDGFENSPS